MIDNVLVANRGEIALRVFRSCRDAGMGTVAVYSDADADSPHTADADVAVRLPGSAAMDTYLFVDAIMTAAAQAGADAVHPGYGFLSENAEFAQAVLDHGLVWVGPPPEAIAAMGSKVRSKELMAAAGVPVLPELAPDQVTERDLPVLVKASAGGGGRGMRVVHELTELADAITGARAEASSAFGDATVFCERYLPKGRHIEVQVMADQYGTVWTIGERECSIQRRHQKVIEEAPSPAVDGRMRGDLLAAAHAAAKAIDYVGAGTVEFIATDDGRFYFLEMNTRLQVEHPVTECTTGVDLVALQLGIAQGQRLPTGPPRPAGHAIEARLYAEDPEADWQPQSGTVHRFAVPGAAEFTRPDGVRGEQPLPARGLRLDSGIADRSMIGMHYDPLLAKVIAWAPERTEASKALAGALARAKIHGVATNRDLLVRVLRHPAFLAGDVDTSFVEQHRHGNLARPLADEDTIELCVLAAALADAAHNRASARVLGGLPNGWRNLPSAWQRKSYVAGGTTREAAYRFGRCGLTVKGGEDVRLIDSRPDRVVLRLGQARRTFDVARYPGMVCVDSPLGAVRLEPVPRFAEREQEEDAGSLLAPMPAVVSRVSVSEGDTVTAGTTLLWLEAMKMEHRVSTSVDGVVIELPIAPGQQVEQGSMLAIVTKKEVE